MRRWWALLGKEVRQHRWSWLGLGLLLLGAQWVILGGVSLEDDATSLLDAAPRFLLVFIPLACLALAQQLVVSEYSQRTQTFLEILPLRRWELAAVKFSLGAALLFSGTAVCLSMVVTAAQKTEPIDSLFLAFMLARALGWTFFMWSFCFAIAFTGRFRTAIYLGVVVGLFALSALTEFDLHRVGPLALIEPSQFGYEREQAPWEELGQTLGAGLALVLLAFLLQMFHEGSLAEELSRRMSQKEKAVVFTLFALFMLGTSYFDVRRAKAPYEFNDESVVAARDVPIQILYGEESCKKPAELLLQDLRRLGDLRQALGWSRLPEIRITCQRSLDGRTFEEATLAENDGVLVRCDFMEPEFARPAFLAYLVRAVLVRASHHRALLESRRWALDGFSLWWAQPGQEERILRLRARWAFPQGVPEAELRTWDTVRERLGPGVAEAVAYSGMRSLESARGRQAVLALARELWGREPGPRDSRRLFEEWRRPFPVQLEMACGLTLPDLVRAWNHDPAVLDASGLPRPHGSIRVQPAEGTARNLEFSLQMEQPLPPGTSWGLVHARLGPFDWELLPTELKNEGRLWPSREGRLAGAYVKGDRVFVAVEVQDPVLGTLRLDARRLELP